MTTPYRDRYHRLRLLGEGGQARVWLAEDQHRRGHRVAVKQLIGPGASTPDDLRAEFLAVAELRHPSLVRAKDFLFDASGTPEFVMEYVDGLPFDEATRVNPDRLPRLIAEALDALSFLHGFGWTHRDLKPANLLVRRAPLRGASVVVLDFGLALRGGQRESGPAAGTMPYLAPEVITDGRADARTDLYALGVVVYESVFGRLPIAFDPSDLAGFVDRVRHGCKVPDAPEDQPAGLKTFLQSLLDPKPENRPNDADEALARLNVACDTAFGFDTEEARRSRLTSGPPIGRAQVRTQLLESIESPTARGVWIVGDAGSGKSRILRWLHVEAIRRGYHVRRLGTTELHNARSYLEELRRVSAVQPIVILADNLLAQTGRTTELIERVSADCSEIPLTFVAAIRPGELELPGIAPLIKATESGSALERSDLGPLTRDELLLLARRALRTSTIGAHHLDWLESASGGNAEIAVRALASAAWERGELLPRPDHARSRRAAPSLRLTEAERILLSVLAALGGAASRDQVVWIASRLDVSAQATFERLVDRGLLVRQAGDVQLAFRSFGDESLDRLLPERRAQLYRATAEHLAAIGADRSVLAELHLRARDRDAAIADAQAVLREAESEGDAVAEEYWCRFLLASLPRRDERRSALRSRQSELLRAVGNAAASIKAARAAVRLASTDLERLDGYCLLARAATIVGESAAASKAIVEAARLADTVGGSVSRGRVSIEEGVHYYSTGELEMALQCFSGAAKEFASEMVNRYWIEATHLAAMTSSRLGHPDAENRFAAITDDVFDAMSPRLRVDHLMVRATHERRTGRLADAIAGYNLAGELARKFRLRRPQLYAQLNSALLEIHLGRLDRGMELAKSAELLAAHLDFPSGRVSARLSEAEALILAGRAGQAVLRIRQCLESAWAARSGWQRHFAELTLAEGLIALGAPPANEVGDILDRVALVAGKDHQLDLAQVVIGAEASIATGTRTLYRAAEAKFREFEPSVLSQSWANYLGRFLLVRAEWARRDGEFARARDVVAEVLALARGDEFASLRASALAVLATIESDSGDRQAHQQVIREGRSMLDSASLAIADPDLRADFMAQPRFAPLRREVDAATSAEERLLAIYEMIRGLNSESDPDRLLESMLDMALQVVGAERGMILLRDAAGGEYGVRLARNLERETIRDAEEFSRNVVMQAGSGRPVLAVDTGDDERLRSLKSVSLYGIRSVLCVPLCSRGEPIGAVYLDSRSPGTLFDDDDLRFLEAFADHAALALGNARARRQLEEENLRLRVAANTRDRFGTIVGRAPAMQQIYDLIPKYASAGLPVLIVGESGTGKELVARALHVHGTRKDGPFLTENCAAIADTLLESELFGHVRGAFTGADRDRTGLFEQASGGTLFLDEVGDMSPAMQARLLRVLQEGEIRRVGDDGTIDVDVHVIAATHRDLQQEVAGGRFREDLMYRLQVLVLALPPLRERIGDVPLLVDVLLERIARARGRETPPTVRRDVMDLLERYTWPGNVRQLENTLQRLALLAGEGPVDIAAVENDRGLREMLLPHGAAPTPVMSLERNERERIRQALSATGGNRAGAARLLGISRATIFRKIKEYGLS